jgi:hypothetical protein
MVVRIEVDTSGLSKMSAWVAGLQTRYLRDVLPLVAEVHLGTSWAETH